MAETKAYAIKDPKGEICGDSIEIKKHECTHRFGYYDWAVYYRKGYRCVPVLITEQPEVHWTLQDIIDSVQYGFDYRDISQNNGKNVPNGNVLQWLMGKKKLIDLPEEFKKFKITEVKK